MSDNEPRSEGNPGSLSAMINHYREVDLFLQRAGINPILYGSVGVGAYLGDFKQFDDLDILVEDRWLNENWSDLLDLLKGHGFALVDAKEHEFEDNTKHKLNFSNYGILTRDGIADPEGDVVSVTVDGVEVKTLKPEAFLRAYEFSVKDGYREQSRGKKDAFVIERLKSHLEIKK